MGSPGSPAPGRNAAALGAANASAADETSSCGGRTAQQRAEHRNAAAIEWNLPGQRFFRE